MKKIKSIFMVVLIFSLLIVMNHNLFAQVNKQDSLALVALYDSTDGANWTDNSNWLSGPVSTWFGVTVKNNRVTKLILRQNNLEGAIPAEIGDLVYLLQLNLSENQIAGLIPPEIGILTNLTLLNLGNNQLSDTIPSEIGNLMNLTECYLYGNQLSGAIPPEIGNLINLINLNLSFNQLSSTIPPELGNLYNVQLITFGYNQLLGIIPPELGNLKNLTELYLQNNQFSDSVPIEISSLTNLKKFYLGNNRLNDLPDLSIINTLTDLVIRDNEFTFEDIEPNIDIPNFFYSPQDSVGIKQDTTINQNSSLTLSVSIGGKANQFQWMKDEMEIPGADSSSYTIHSADSSDAGSYVCRITNTIATQLILYCRPIHVTVDGITGVTEPSAQVPEVFALYQNYPNPFNPSTTIRFTMSKQQNVRLSVYNLLGQLVRTLIDEDMKEGWHSVVFNAAGFASGVYFYRIQTESFVSTKRFILLK